MDIVESLKDIAGPSDTDKTKGTEECAPQTTQV